MGRNLCRSPWRNLVHLSIRQNLGFLPVGGLSSTLARASLQLDVFNLMNLLNPDWGKQEDSGFGNQTLLQYRSKEAGSAIGADGARYRYTFNPNLKFSNSDNVQSNYRMQLGIRYSF
jgi:hypothetical protein